MGIFGKIKNFFMERKLNKEMESLGKSYLDGLGAMVSTVQIYRAIDRQLHKELFGSTASEKLEEIEKERKELQISLDRCDYILKFLSKGSFGIDKIDPCYEPDVLVRHKEISLKYTADMINLVVQTLVYSELTRFIYEHFEEAFIDMEMDKEKVFSYIEDIYKDKDKVEEHTNYIVSTLIEEFGVNPMEPKLKIAEMVNNLVIAARECPSEVELILNRPLVIGIDEDGAPTVTI